MGNNFVCEFLYNDSCCESAAATLSIHKSKKGAEMALMFHKGKVEREYNKMESAYTDEFDFDFDKWWGVQETELKD